MGSHSTEESSLEGRVWRTFRPVTPRRKGWFEAVRYLLWQLLRRTMLSYSGTISTSHLALLVAPLRSWRTDSSSSSAVRYLSWWLRKRTTLARWKKSMAERESEVRRERDEWEMCEL
ncbi:hypothetical protein PIB30_117485 [Stylosanthes scabra]|uniref:Uncharacterized protein n=1 Tax=Stylosanthes scabra TaxID=79078 RepID=A0ABU6QE68_9FABA|nr:hypothetical protein [Stylosanthes scabra]